MFNQKTYEKLVNEWWKYRDFQEEKDKREYEKQSKARSLFLFGFDE
jgi:hypothetical protein